jgi:hypothetical protein
MGVNNGDLYIYKEGSKTKSYSRQQQCFNYHGIENALTGKIGQNNPFTPKRITVIQMK